MEEKPVVLFYDSECSLCTRFKQALEKFDEDKLIHFRSIHDPKTFEEYPKLNKEECKEVVHLVDEFGKIYKGGEAMIFLVSIFPGLKKFLWLIDSKSGKAASNFFYSRLNDMRLMQKRKCFRCGTGKRT